MKFVFLLALAAAVACSRSTSPADSEIRNLYARYASAVRQMDSASYMKFFARDFSMRSPDGRVHDRAEMDKYQRINAITTKRVNAYTADLEAITHPTDSTTAVIVLQKYDRDQAPLEEPDKPHRIQTSAVQREIWRITGERPRIWRIEEILVGPLLIDGKLQQ